MEFKRFLRVPVYSHGLAHDVFGFQRLPSDSDGFLCMPKKSYTFLQHCHGCLHVLIDSYAFLYIPMESDRVLVNFYVFLWNPMLSNGFLWSPIGPCGFL